MTRVIISLAILLSACRYFPVSPSKTADDAKKERQAEIISPGN